MLVEMLMNVHLLFILVLLFIMLKMSLVVSQRLLAGLKFYHPPSNDQISGLVPEVKPNTLSKKKVKKLVKGKSSELDIIYGPINTLLFLEQPEYDPYDSVVFLSTLAVASFIFGEFWTCFTNADHSEYSFAVVAIAVCFTWFSLLRQLLRDGWSNPLVKLSLGSGAIMFGVCLGFLFLVDHPRMKALALDIDFSGYDAFLSEFNAFMKQQSLSIRLETPIKYYRLLLALMGGLISVLVVMPCLKAAVSYQFIINNPTSRREQRRPGYSVWSKSSILRFLSHVNFFFPMVLAMLWMPYLTKDMIVTEDGFISDSLFNTVRLALSVVASVLRVCLFQLHAQAHIDKALGAIRGGPLNQSSGVGIQHYLARVICDTPRFALEYLGPAVSSLLCVLLLKRKLGLCWGLCTLLVDKDSADNAVGFDEVEGSMTDITHNSTGNMTANPTSGASPFTVTQNPLVPTTLTFLVWWTQLAWFAACCIGLLYIRHTDAAATQQGSYDEQEPASASAAPSRSSKSEATGHSGKPQLRSSARRKAR